MSKPEPKTSLLPPHPKEWEGRAGLISMVRDAVQAVDWPHKESNFKIDESQCFPSTLLMTLLTYCYAKGIYSSEQVAEAVKLDPTLRALFEKVRPEAETIRKFRRRHHEDVKQCLLWVLRFAFPTRFGEQGKNETPIDHCVALALDRWFEPICGPVPEREAAERLDRAGFWDGMSQAD
jgi:hypothetical protein